MVLLFFKCTKCFIVITTCRVIILCSWYVCVFMCFCAVKSAQCISMLSDLRSRPRSHRRVLNTHPNVGWLDLDFVCCPVSSGLCTSSWGFKFAWEVWRVKVGQVSQWEYFCFSFFFFFKKCSQVSTSSKAGLCRNVRMNSEGWNVDFRWTPPGWWLFL